MDTFDKKSANQERFTGTLLGMAIGDAMGMPVAGWSPDRIRDTYQRIESYFPKYFEDGAELKAGEFTEESEIALCIVESYSVGDAELEPDVILARMRFLAAGESRRWIQSSTLAAIEEEGEFGESGPPSSVVGLDVVSRGIPIGLIHSIGALSFEQLRGDARTVTELTHRDPASATAVTLVAIAVALAARRSVSLTELPQAMLAFVSDEPSRSALEHVRELVETKGGQLQASTFADLPEVVNVAMEGIAVASKTGRFEEAVFQAVNAGGPSDTRGAVAGAIAGAWHGSSGIPQRLVDELEGRIYLSVAVPWFYRAVQRKSGRTLTMTPASSDAAEQSPNGQAPPRSSH